MIPISLRLKNFLGIISGLNREELYLNFEEIVGDAQLVAVIGHNGAGKTTVIDNMHPYRIMPSKVKNYSPGSFSYYDETVGNAEKEFIFSDDDTLYRSSIVIKGTNKTKKTEVYLFYQDASGNWEPVSAANGTVSDGKTATYDACVNDLLGTPEMFFSSHFAAQGRQAISAYDNGDIKSLMSELLNMSHVVELGRKAGDVKKTLQMKLTSMQSDLAKAAENESKKTALSESIKATDIELGRAKRNQPAVRSNVQKATRNLAEIQAKNNQDTEIEIRRNALDSRKTFAHSQHTGKTKEIGSDVNQIDEREKNELVQKNNSALRLKQQIINYGKQKVSYAQQIVGYKQLITRQNDLINKKPQIDAAKEKSPGLSAGLATLVAKRGSLHEDVKTIRSLTAKRNDLAVKAQELASKGKAKKGQLDDYTTRAKLCDEVPCQGSGLQSDCKLLKNALSAKSECSSLTTELNIARSEFATFKGQIETITSEIAGLGNPQDQMTELQKQIDGAQAGIDSNNKIIDLSDACDNADKEITSYNDLITETNRSIESTDGLILEAEASIDEIKNQVKQLTIDATKSKELLKKRKVDADSIRDTEIANIEEELKQLPPPIEANGLEQAESELSSADTELANLDLFIETKNNAIAVAKAELDQVILALYGAKKLTALGDKLENEIAYWVQLQMALGIDGIIALSIDDAGPTLAGYTNDLLSSCYGHRFSVRIETQKTIGNGNKKETFDITVFDSESDTEKSIGSMSGGQRVWINEAITRAIALYQASLAGKHMKTIFSDELDGALDAENKRMFLNMKREVLRIGKYDKEYFISHTPELWQMADAVIDISDYKH